MTPLTDEELLALITDMESDQAERKRAWKGDAPEKGRQAVCAFANDLPNHGKPGVLFIGVEDSGAPTAICWGAVWRWGGCGPPMRRQCVWRGASGFAPGHGVRRHRRRTSVC